MHVPSQFRVKFPFLLIGKCFGKQKVSQKASASRILSNSSQKLFLLHYLAPCLWVCDWDTSRNRSSDHNQQAHVRPPTHLSSAPPSPCLNLGTRPSPLSPVGLFLPKTLPKLLNQQLFWIFEYVIEGLLCMLNSLQEASFDSMKKERSCRKNYLSWLPPTPSASSSPRKWIGKMLERGWKIDSPGGEILSAACNKFLYHCESSVCGISARKNQSSRGGRATRRSRRKEINGQNPIISHCKIEYVTIVPFGSTGWVGRSEAKGER